MTHIPDPFEEAKSNGPVLAAELDGDTIPMILRLKDVRAAAKDWQTFSSDAPFRVPIPAEESVRSVRQFPIEVDPPIHAAYRKLVEPFFLRPKQPEVAAKIDALVVELLDRALGEESLDLVQDFAIPLQSRALTYLLNVDEKEAEIWIDWGIHVFEVGDGDSKGSQMEAYSERMFREKAANPGEDFFSALNEADFEGRKLTMEEKLGFANLAFAGGRDTIIHTATRIIHFFAHNPQALQCLREHPDRVKTAAEEFFRMFIPLTHIGRVCPHATNVHGHEVPAGGRVSLCWSSANRDPEMFAEPNEVKLDRRPNPHVAFGFGPHNCLGAHHSRVIMRSLITQLGVRISKIEILEEREVVERQPDYERMVGYEYLKARLSA